MKIVREHINEKFTEVSDPVQDMGIGVWASIPEIGQRKNKSFDLFEISKTICKIYRLPVKNYTPIDEKSNYNWEQGYQTQKITMNLDDNLDIHAKFLGLDYNDRIKLLMGKDYVCRIRLGISSVQNAWIKSSDFEFRGNQVYIFVNAGGYSIPTDFAKQTDISKWLSDKIKDEIVQEAIWDLAHTKNPLFYKKKELGNHMKPQIHAKIDVRAYVKKYGKKDLEDLMRQNYMWNTEIKNWKIDDGIIEYIT